MATYKGEYISGIGKADERINEITADEVATLRRFITKWESGVVECNNIFNKTTTTDGYEIYGNTIAQNSEYFVSDFIEVKPNTVYYKANDDMGWAIFTYNSNKQPIERNNFDRNTWLWHTTDSSVKYIKFDGKIAKKDKITLREYALGYIQDGTQITITKGAIFAYGYIGFLDKNTAFYFNPTASTQYHFIYAEFDKSTIPNTFKIKVKNNQGGADIKPNTFRQDILSTVKTGVYQLPLYRITLTAQGITEIKDLTLELELRKSCIKQVYKVDTTQRITGTIHGSVTGTTQAINDNSTKLATTEFVHNVISTYISQWVETIITKKVRTTGVPTTFDIYFSANFTPTKVKFNNTEFNVVGQNSDGWYYRVNSSQGADNMTVGSTIYYM